MADRVSKNYVAKGRAANPGQQARPFQCKWHEGCAKSFNRKSDLQRHYRIHTNERPYACDYKPCEKTFIQRSALTVHRRTHTGDKPHKCPYVGCGKCFSDSSSLARHRRIHTNDKPYICKNPHCRKAFCRKTTMTKHFRKEHPSDPIKEEEDAEYSDIEDSEDEADEENDDGSHEEIYETTEPGREATHTPSQASTYSADLWPLPGQTKPRHLQGLHKRSASSTDLVKSEREFSRTPQRMFTDPYPTTHEQQQDYMLSRSNTMPNHIVPPSSVPSSMGDMQQFIIEGDNRMWNPQSALSDSPTSLSSGSSGFAEGGFPQQTFQVPAMAMQPHQVSQYPQQHQVSELQAVHDIILDDPSPRQYTNMTSAQPHQQPRYTSVPQQPHPQILAAQQQGFHVSRPGTPQYPNDLPGTPGPNQPIQYMSNDPLYGLDTFPTQQFVPSQTNMINYNAYDLFKEFKSEDNFMQLPGQVMQGMWGQ